MAAHLGIVETICVNLRRQPMLTKEKQVKREEPEKIQKIDIPIFLSNQGEEEEEDSFAA